MQTVPRAELFCLVWLVSKVAPYSDIEYITDNEGLFNTYNNGPAAGMHSINADLYHKLFKTTIDKAIRVRVRWMPSHLACSDSRPISVSELDVLGNHAADQQAGMIAKHVTVPLNVSAPIIS